MLSVTGNGRCKTLGEVAEISSPRSGRQRGDFAAREDVLSENRPAPRDAPPRERKEAGVEGKGSPKEEA